VETKIHTKGLFLLGNVCNSTPVFLFKEGERMSLSGILAAEYILVCVGVGEMREGVIYSSTFWMQDAIRDMICLPIVERVKRGMVV